MPSLPCNPKGHLMNQLNNPRCTWHATRAWTGSTLFDTLSHMRSEHAQGSEPER